jgi:two-component system sensor histidine kinase PhoQ
LAVIHSQGDLSDTSTQQLTVINRTIEHQLKRAQSAGESLWHLGVSIPNVMTKLINSLGKIYRDKEVDFTVTYNGIDGCLVEASELEALTFKGDEADLFEILGNLLDNACKAAKQKVAISVTQYFIKDKGHLTIVISDDGSGIDSCMQESILQRGVRADTYQQGHGIGLAIVRDLVNSYQGKLSISDSDLLGGAEFTLLFTNH